MILLLIEIIEYIYVKRYYIDIVIEIFLLM